MAERNRDLTFRTFDQFTLFHIAFMPMRSIVMVKQFYKIMKTVM